MQRRVSISRARLADPLGLRKPARHLDPGVEPRPGRKWWDEVASDENATHMEVSASECSPPRNGGSA